MDFSGSQSISAETRGFQWTMGDLILPTQFCIRLKFQAICPQSKWRGGVDVTRGIKEESAYENGVRKACIKIR